MWPIWDHFWVTFRTTFGTTFGFTFGPLFGSLLDHFFRFMFNNFFSIFTFFSKICVYCLLDNRQRRLRRTKATNSTKIAEIIRIFVSDCQCEKLPFADFGIHNSKNVAVVRVRLWKLFFSCCVVHGTEQCILKTTIRSGLTHSPSQTQCECAAF